MPGHDCLSNAPKAPRGPGLRDLAGGPMMSPAHIWLNANMTPIWNFNFLRVWIVGVCVCVIFFSSWEGKSSCWVPSALVLYQQQLCNCWSGFSGHDESRYDVAKAGCERSDVFRKTWGCFYPILHRINWETWTSLLVRVEPPSWRAPGEKKQNADTLVAGQKASSVWSFASEIQLNWENVAVQARSDVVKMLQPRPRLKYPDQDQIETLNVQKKNT